MNNHKDFNTDDRSEARLKMPPNSPRLHRKSRVERDEFLTIGETEAETFEKNGAQKTASHDSVIPRPKLGGRGRHRRLSGRQVVGLSFLIPFAVLALSFIAMGFFPFGERTPLTIDLYHQYAPFLVQMRDKMTGDFNLFYSWNGGLGNNFYALFAYYLSSPLNLLLFLFPAAWVTEAVTLLTLLKVGAAGATFAYFLRNAFCIWGEQTVCLDPPVKETRYSRTATSFAVVMTSSFFALSGFMLTYSWDIMWLDAIALMPLMMLGLHRLIRDGRFMTYVLSLAAILLCNYYIALFICIFTIFYYPVCYFSLAPYLKGAAQKPGRHFIMRTLQVAGASLLGAGVSAILSIPTYLSLQLTSASTDKFPEVWAMRFSMFDFIGRHLPAMPPSIRDGLPNVYTGVLTFALIPLYIGAKHIRLGEKLLHLIFLVFMFISFNLNGLDFIWHGMHYPNQLPYRYSFVYSFLVLIMCFRALTQVRSFKARTLAMAFGGGILYAILAEAISPDLVDHTSAYVAIVLLAIYFLIALTLV
ncbi:MAG TPA: YfhO family protein, partial [Clostridiaceae bacterium]|nr:YfhO family protein [Clostridiaceae bacterium]